MFYAILHNAHHVDATPQLFNDLNECLEFCQLENSKFIKGQYDGTWSWWLDDSRAPAWVGVHPCHLKKWLESTYQSSPARVKL